MPFENQLETLETKIERVQAMGGADKVQRQHARGRYTARERIDRLLDPDTFFEVGRFAHSDMPGLADKTPADSKITGYGKINNRRVAVSANDFTVMAATTSRIAGRKEGELKQYAARKKIPMIYLGEAGGARMPDIMGSKGLASFGGGSFDSYLKIMSRIRQSPMVTAILGECYGMPTWMACLSDFVVQVKGSSMGVSGPRVLEMALGQTVTDEELGGFKVHSEITGNVDRVAQNEDHCFDIIRQYLSYLPSHSSQLPPIFPVPDGSGEKMEQILDFLPQKRSRTYDMHTLLLCIVDTQSLFAIKPEFGKSVITALARINGKSVGIVANQPSFLAGAMDTDGIDKVTSFLCQCDTYNIPLVFFHDTPGFLVGKEAEKNRVAARVMNYMNALGQISVPKISVIIRKSYGMAFWNMSGSGCATDFLVAWPTAEMSFVDPAIAANVVHGSTEADPDQKQKLIRSMVEDASPFGAAGLFHIHDVIDPRHTRKYITDALEIAGDTDRNGIGEHRLANWPTKF
ncbi:MAG: carboxyl transferase [Proteobacteria bacterium]|nr:carboxyl transferase [Pseudomonadota bacterium]MBU1582979.1 carboxyl transferase [Pseudomonadota bacterium]MBU2454823.1 carboxyl transferase [Pseudomonadota bacterium]MBU2631772.1 carboxyl transferase [Pseudomonadota bacterium]